MKIVRKKTPPKRQVLERIAQQLDGSTISNEAFVATLFTEALSIILQDLDDRIRATYITNGVMVAGEPESILSGMKDYCDAARRQVAEYYRSISRRLEECTYGYKGAECYDNFRRSANDVARIVMKMADKGKEEGVLARIEEFIDAFEAQGRFTEDDYKRFILR